MKFHFLFLFAFLPITAVAAEYEGRVGKWEANFSINFHEDGTVSGTYSYPRRPGVVYQLKGDNREQGKLNLNEFTGKNLTARCTLTKKNSESRIIWEGLMFNTDGRGPFEMSFSRAREKKESHHDALPPSPAVITIPDYWPFSHTRMNAHVYGKVYFGTFGGETAWSALLFEGENVEKRVLNGTNPETGVLLMNEGGGAVWKFRKILESNRLE